jgi:hypothetical protein
MSDARLARAIALAEWADYKRNGDRRHLAKICRTLDFCGVPEIGEEIAKLLTLDYKLGELRSPAIERESEAAKLKGMWLSMRGAIDKTTGEKIPDRVVMAHIGKKLGLKSSPKDGADPDAQLYRLVRQRLKRLDLL